MRGDVPTGAGLAGIGGGMLGTDMAAGAGRGGVLYVDMELLGVITRNRFFWPKRTAV